MEAAIENVIAAKHAQDLRDLWQARALKLATGQTAAVLLSVLAHNYDDAMPVLLRVVFPGFTSITAPFYCSAAKIAKTGDIVADRVERDGRIVRQSVVYRSERELRSEFRKLADRLKLSDAERIELFKCVQRWVVADARLDPNLDPRDPDARRLVH